MLDFGMWNWWTFLTVLILVFSLMLVVTGIFTAYFGSGKSRGIGIGLLVVGLVIGLMYIIMASSYNFLPIETIGDNVYLSKIIIEAIMYLLAAIIGALIALGVFLGSIMKA
jgi:hypothetical protein